MAWTYRFLSTCGRLATLDMAQLLKVAQNFHSWVHLLSFYLWNVFLGRNGLCGYRKLKAENWKSVPHNNMINANSTFFTVDGMKLWSRLEAKLLSTFIYRSHKIKITLTFIFHFSSFTKNKFIFYLQKMRLGLRALLMYEKCKITCRNICPMTWNQRNFRVEGVLFFLYFVFSRGIQQINKISSSRLYF